MTNEIKQVVAYHADLTQEERNLLSVAYKNTIFEIKKQLKIISYLEMKGEKKGLININILRNYKRKVEE